jgi:tryptophanyl-tRNA synthetase
MRALTGIRPTGDLTVANYVGAIEPMVALQDTFEGPINAFVADIHALTDQEPDVINRTRLDTVRAFMAGGVSPARSLLYLQSQIGSETQELAGVLDRHMSVAELLRVPNLKDKVKEGDRIETASVALARYPILMAADIIIEDATHVPVGQDQLPHIEVTRKLARRFNTAYGDGQDILVVPEHLAAESIKIAALNGDPKMSKSQPRGAIFLNDTPDDVHRKIRRAHGAEPGEMTDVLASHYLLSERLARTPQDVAELAAVKRDHMDGQPVMGRFKELMGGIVTSFLVDYQDRFNSISDAEVKQVLRDGGEQARDKADAVLTRVRTSMNFVPDSFLYQ